MDPIIIVTGKDLIDLKFALAHGEVSKLSVHVDGEHVKFKVNERMWSPALGKKSEDY